MARVGPDYRIRPAKAVLRRILLEAIERLKFIGDLSEYDYYGFGSFSFVDFNLFHRRLKLPRLVSMENEPGLVQRARFNVPFSCVTVEPYDASVVLARLPTDRKAVVWLDYTRRLDGTVLADLAQVYTRAAPGSLVVVTVNADEMDDPDATASRFENEAGRDLASASWSSRWIADGRYSSALESVIEKVALRTLRDRNSDHFGTPGEILYRRLLGLSYSDSTPMFCTAGLVHAQSQSPRVGECRFDTMDFYQSGSDPKEIRVPVLTPREVWFLNSIIPEGNWSKLQGSGITKRDAEAFLDIYRYYPPFVEAELY